MKRGLMMFLVGCCLLLGNSSTLWGQAPYITWIGFGFDNTSPTKNVPPASSQRNALALAGGIVVFGCVLRDRMAS